MSGISFEIWDATGQEKYRRLVRHYFQNCQGFFFVVDSSDRDRFEEARDVLLKIIGDEYMVSVPFVVMANKSKRLWYFQPVCAITGEGISEAMQQLSKMIKDTRQSGISR